MKCWILNRIADIPRVNIQKQFRFTCWIVTILCGAWITHYVSIINATCYSKPPQEKEILRGYGEVKPKLVRSELFKSKMYDIFGPIYIGQYPPPAARVRVDYMSGEIKKFKQLKRGDVLAIDYSYPDRLLLRNKVGAR